MTQNSPSRRSSINSISSINSFFNSPGSPLRLNNLATTPSPIRRLRNLNPSPPNQRRRRRGTRRNSPNFSIRSPSPAPSYNFNASINHRNLNNILRNLNNTPHTPDSPLPDFNGSPIFTTSGQSPILTTVSNQENIFNNTPPPSPPRLTRSGPARRLNFNSPVRSSYNRTRKSRRSTNYESYLSRENLNRLRGRRRELVLKANRAPHNLASNFDPTIPVAAAEPVVHPVNIQRATPVVTLENHYAPLAVVKGKNVSNTVISANKINKIRNKRKQRKTKRLNNMLKKRKNKNKRNTKKK